MSRPKAQRNAEIVQRHLAGETMGAIARSLGITRERVRQVVRARGVSRSESMVARSIGRTGRRTKTGMGYVEIYLPHHHRAKKDGYVLEHIVVAEYKIGRRLKRAEVVHHVNGVRDDNRPENLQVLTATEHTRLHSRLYTPELMLDALRWYALQLGHTPTQGDMEAPEFPLHWTLFYTRSRRPGGQFATLTEATSMAGLTPNAWGTPGHGGAPLPPGFRKQYAHLARFRSVEEMADALHGGLCTEHERRNRGAAEEAA